MAEHNIRVVTLLTGDEYLAMQSMADSEGMSDSAFIRRLLKLEAQKRAMAKVSALMANEKSAEPAQLVRSASHSPFHA
jgi:negative regulator of replication initiation